jgi:regulatory protein
MAFGKLSLKGRAVRYLSQREHSRAELVRKLHPHAEDQPEASAAAQISQALDELTENGLLSDERAAASVLASQAARSGQRRLQQLLQTKGLDPALVARTLAQAKGSEFERASALWQRRFGSLAVQPAERARQMRFLQARGFGFDVIARVMRGAGQRAVDDGWEPTD